MGKSYTVIGRKESGKEWLKAEYHCQKARGMIVRMEASTVLAQNRL